MAIELTYARSLQGDGVCNEDVYGIAPNAAWVMDGATGLGTQLREGVTEAARYVSLFSKVLESLLASSEPLDTRDLLRAAIERTARGWPSALGAPPEVVRHSTSPTHEFHLGQYDLERVAYQCVASTPAGSLVRPSARSFRQRETAIRSVRSCATLGRCPCRAR